MIEQKKICCALCGSDQYDLLFEGVDRLHGFDGSFSYVKCKQCGLIYMNPQICAEHMGYFYPNDYAPHQANTKRIQDKDAARANLRKRPFFECLCRKLTQDSRVLDVGCGNGFFLSQIRALTQCHVSGIDISPIATEAAKKNYGLDIFTGTILESPFPDNYFDVITAWSFLEHVNNPAEVLLKFSSLLKKDGVCILTTPNFDSFNAKLFKDKWYHLDCPRHLFIYNPKTITTLLEKSGLHVKKIIYDKASKGVLGSLQYQFYGDNYNPRHRNRLRRSSLVKKIASPYARLAAIMKKSDVMAICAEKNPSPEPHCSKV
ncbi:MAG: class I SAM-dependent methyltransferase [Desulfobulbaceae bacterium]|nr:class I SAM-dependent methyltransferase [Desulfobulbaceae bacterium]